MKSAMSTYIRRILVVAIATGVMGSTGWGQEIETAVTSLVIGGVTLQEDVKNLPVPSGMQMFEITFNSPISSGEDRFSYGIAGLQIHAYPFEFAQLFYDALSAPDLVISEDRMKLTGTVNLPEDETYQMLISRKESDPIEEQQQYFWGTVELPDAVISGVAILPEGFTPRRDEFGGVALIDPERYLKALAGDQDFDLFDFAIVRITDFNEKLEFELKHVPDGNYALLSFQEGYDAQGNRKDLGTLVGINILTGAVDTTALVQVVNGQSVTELPIMLQGESEPEVVDITEVRVQSVNAENNSFSIQPSRSQQISVDASQALIIHLDPKHIDDILPVFLSGNIDDLIKLVFPISNLMVGDLVSIFGVAVSETEIQALMVIRHHKLADIDSDDDVDFVDFLLFAAAFGTSEGSPEYDGACRAR